MPKKSYFSKGKSIFFDQKFGIPLKSYGGTPPHGSEGEGRVITPLWVAKGASITNFADAATNRICASFTSIRNNAATPNFLHMPKSIPIANRAHPKPLGHPTNSPILRSLSIIRTLNIKTKVANILPFTLYTLLSRPTHAIIPGQLHLSAHWASKKLVPICPCADIKRQAQWGGPTYNPPAKLQRNWNQHSTR